MFECEEDGARYTHPQVTLWDRETVELKRSCLEFPFWGLDSGSGGRTVFTSKVYRIP